MPLVNAYVLNLHCFVQLEYECKIDLLIVGMLINKRYRFFYVHLVPLRYQTIRSDIGKSFFFCLVHC